MRPGLFIVFYCATKSLISFQLWQSLMQNIIL